MIAEAYEVDADDPDFLEAGPREGDDRVEGLERFVDFTSPKSPVFKTALTAALQEQAQAHERALADLRAQHKVDLEAADERGRAQARSPFGRNGAPPRSTGTGVLPVGQDNDGTGGQRAPAKAPTVASVRDALVGRGTSSASRPGDAPLPHKGSGRPCGPSRRRRSTRKTPCGWAS